MRLGVAISGPVCSCIAPWICTLLGMCIWLLNMNIVGTKRGLYYCGGVLRCCQHLEMHSVACVCWTSVGCGVVSMLC
jgi:hypothetical protein